MPFNGRIVTTEKQISSLYSFFFHFLLTLGFLALSGQIWTKFHVVTGRSLKYLVSTESQTDLRRIGKDAAEGESPDGIAYACGQRVSGRARLQFVGNHILSVDQFQREDIEHIFRVADDLRPYATRMRVTRVLS